MSCESLSKEIFQRYDIYKAPKLFVGTSVVGTRLGLEGTLWQQKAKSTRRRTQITTFNKLEFPQPIVEKNMEKINNVYSKLIFPGQYIFKKI